MIGVTGRVLEIHSHGAGINHVARSSAGIFRSLPISRLYVRGHRYPDVGGDLRDGSNHLVIWNLLTIGESLRKRNARAGCRNRRKSRLFNDASAGDIPDVGQQQSTPSCMHRPEGFRLLRLLEIRHTRDWMHSPAAALHLFQEFADAHHCPADGPEPNLLLVIASIYAQCVEPSVE